MKYTRIIPLPLELDHDYSIFLFGPRGTGKTSFLRSRLPDALYLDLLDNSLYSHLKARPSRLAELIPSGYKNWIILDEVQKIPKLLDEVHRLIELKRYQFILTGSSARALRREGVNLLAGRALRYYMHPLIAQEMGDDFNVQRSLQVGLLPAAVTRKHPQKYLEAYASSYIKEEIAQEGILRNIDSFTEFLEVASFSQAQQLNYSEIARELGVNRKLVNSYFTILEDLLLGKRIKPFTKRAKRKMVAHQKFFYFDVGIYKAIRPMGPLDTSKEADGAGLETLFFQSVLAVNEYYELGYSIYFWRTAGGAEVDFVLYGKNGLHAFEIKRGAHLDKKSLRGLKMFQSDYPEAKLHLLYGGDHYEYHDNITIHPFEQALKKLPEILSAVKNAA